jgi:hypothetical protein
MLCRYSPLLFDGFEFLAGLSLPRNFLGIYLSVTWNATVLSPCRNRRRVHFLYVRYDRRTKLSFAFSTVAPGIVHTSPASSWTSTILTTVAYSTLRRNFVPHPSPGDLFAAKTAGADAGRQAGPLSPSAFRLLWMERCKTYPSQIKVCHVFDIDIDIESSFPLSTGSLLINYLLLLCLKQRH